jgi:hypothetical protein
MANGSILPMINGALKIMSSKKTKIAVLAAVVVILAAGSTSFIEQNYPFQQESITRITQAKKWALAFILFADTHGNQLPGNFAQLSPTAGLPYANWEIISGGYTTNFGNPAQTILLREREPRQSPRGAFVKAYAFADGHAELIHSPDQDFAVVEKQRGFLVQPGTNGEFTGRGEQLAAPQKRQVSYAEKE